MQSQLDSFPPTAGNAEDADGPAHDGVEQEEERADAVLQVECDAAHLAQLEEDVVVGRLQRVVQRDGDVDAEATCAS